MYDVVVFMWHCMPLVCIPINYVMVRCNDIHLAKVFQYVALSLVGPLSSSRIGSHIARDTLEGYWRSRRHHLYPCSQLHDKAPCRRGGVIADDGAATQR